jgi:hypothetical protein
MFTDIYRVILCFVKIRFSGSHVLHRGEVIVYQYFQHFPVAVAARSKAWFFGRSPAEIVDSNSVGGMVLCLLSIVRFQVLFCATS